MIFRVIPSYKWRISWECREKRTQKRKLATNTLFLDDFTFVLEDRPEKSLSSLER